MPTFKITDPETGRTIRLTGEGGPPTEGEIKAAFSSLGSSDSSVAPNSLASDPMNMTGVERKKWARERENFVNATGTAGTRIKHKFTDPNQEYVTDAPVPVLTKSLGNTLSSIVSAPRDVYEKVKSSFDPSSPDNLRGQQQTFGEGMSTLGSAAVNTVQDLGAPVGLRGIEGMKESWGKAPVQSLATVGLAAPLAARGAKSAVVGAADTLGRTADLASSRLMDMTLKQGTTLKGAKRQQNVQTALEGGYLPNKKGVDKLAADVTATETALGEGIKAGEAANVRGTLDKAIANVEALREEAKRSADPGKYNAMIDAEIERLKGSPMVDESGTIPIGDIQKMKVEQGRAVKYQTKTGQAPDPFQASIDKARIRGMKEELETQLFDVFPELKTTNQRLSNMYGLQDVLERAANRIEQNQGVGIALPIKSGSGAAIGGMLGGPPGAAVGGGIGAMIGIIEHPSVAPRLAKAVYNARKGKISLERARGIVDERLSGITQKLKDERGLFAPFGGDIRETKGQFSDLVDRKAKIEIDDSGAQLSIPKINKALLSGKPSIVPLREILNHDNLYRQHPELQEYNVAFNFGDSSSQGSFDAGQKLITINTKNMQPGKDVRETLLHEIQHAIQERGDFARGGNVEGMRDNFTANRARFDFLAKDEDMKQILDLISAEEDRIIMSDLPDEVVTVQLRAVDTKFRKMYPEYNEYKEVLSRIQGRTADGKEAYHRLAGEEEARRVSARANMPASERMGTPYRLSDIADPRQLIRR